MRKLFRTVIIVLCVVPIGTGLLGIIGGPEFAPDPQTLNPSLDSEYRFVNVFWLAAGVALLWSTFDLEERRSVTRLALWLAFLGGVARLWSVVLTGWPHPVFIGALVLEFAVVPLVLWWHSRVVPTATSAPPSSRGLAEAA